MNALNKLQGHLGGVNVQVEEERAPTKRSILEMNCWEKNLT